MDAEAIKRTLVGSGLRSTPQRYAVMAFLLEHAGHPTAAEIFEAVNRVDPRTSRATTYNNLRDLVQAGLVREVAVEGRAARFEVCTITTSSATVAAMWRTWSGTTCLGPPRAPSVSGFFANVNSFSGGFARSALRAPLPVKYRRRVGYRMDGAFPQARPAAIARMGSHIRSSSQFV
jgi:hypothetical protein